MRKNAILTITGRQSYEGQDPDLIELTTEGSLEQKGDAWILAYEETELTGLEGTKTIIRVENGKVTLGRTGSLHSHMVFQEGVTHDSLYRIPEGALMISVCAEEIQWELSPSGGRVFLRYSIVVEDSAKGTVEFEIHAKTKE